MEIRAYRGRWRLWAGALSAAALLLSTGAAEAGKAAVLDVTVEANPDGTYAFNVVVFHRDEGWKHYADKWQIIAPNGNVVATRTLYHPHVNEQPFMRSLSHVSIPIGINEVTVQAFDTVHGAGDTTMTVKLPPRK